MKKLIARVLLPFVFMVVGIGCVSPGKKHEAWQPIKAEKAFFVHTVKWPGETLPIIAKWYTGDSLNGPFIADANPSIDPDQLSAGNEIFISDDLLKTREPMPMAFIDACQPKPKEEKPPSKPVIAPPKKKPAPVKRAPAPQKVEEFEIVGPK